MSIGGKFVVTTEDTLEIGGVADKLAAIADEAKYVDVNDDATYRIAVDYLDQIDKIFSVVEEIVERFRKPAYEYYKGVLAEKRSMLEPGEEARLVLRLKISKYHKDREMKAEAERKKALEIAKQSILEKATSLYTDAIESGDREASSKAKEMLTNLVEEASAIVESEDIQAAPEIAGITFRDKWVANLKDPRDESLRLLCGAIAEHKAPLGLVRFDRVEANKLARALKDEMKIPGISVTSGETLVKKRK
jgi:hypothetical protein